MKITLVNFIDGMKVWCLTLETMLLDTRTLAFCQRMDSRWEAQGESISQEDWHLYYIESDTNWAYYYFSLGFYHSLLSLSTLCCVLSWVWLFVSLMGYSLPGFFVHGIVQTRILEWDAISYSRGSPQPRSQTWVSYNSCIGRQILYY